MKSSSESKIIQFSKRSSIDVIKRRPLKIRGVEMSSVHRTHSEKSRPPLIALSEEKPIRPSLLFRLRKLDAEQQQIMEIIADAFARGVL